MTPPNPKEAEVVAMELPPLPRAASIMEITDPKDPRRALLVNGYTEEQLRDAQRAAVVAALAQEAPQAAQLGDVPADLRFLLEYIPHTAARREAIRKVEALVAPRRAAGPSLPDVAMPELDELEALALAITQADSFTGARAAFDAFRASATAEKVLRIIALARLAAQPAEGAAAVQAPAEPVAFSCAKRAADPSNESATCRKWCGDCENCYCVGCSSCSEIAAEGATQAGQPWEPYILARAAVIRELHAKGMSDKAIADDLAVTTRQVTIIRGGGSDSQQRARIDGTTQGAQCWHAKAVTQFTGDGRPVEYCPECGVNIPGTQGAQGDGNGAG